MRKFSNVAEIKQERAKLASDKELYTLVGVILGELDRLPIPRTQQPSEADIFKVIKKMYEASKETKNAKEEKYLGQFIPSLMSEDELRETIRKEASSLESPNIGKLMKVLQTNYAGKYDGKMAAKLIKEVLS